MARDGNRAGEWTTFFFGKKHPDICIYCYTCGNFLTPTAHLARSMRHRKLRWSFFQGRKPQKHSKNQSLSLNLLESSVKLPDLTCSNQFFFHLFNPASHLKSPPWYHPWVHGDITSEVASRTLNQLGVPWWTSTHVFFAGPAASFFASEKVVFFSTVWWLWRNLAHFWGSNNVKSIGYFFDVRKIPWGRGKSFFCCFFHCGPLKDHQTSNLLRGLLRKWQDR